MNWGQSLAVAERAKKLALRVREVMRQRGAMGWPQLRDDVQGELNLAPSDPKPGLPALRAQVQSGAREIVRRGRDTFGRADGGARTDTNDPTFRLRHIRRACKTAFVTVGGFSVATNLLMLAVPLYMLQVYDRVLTTRSLDTLLALTLMVVISIAALGLLEATRSAVMTRIGVWLDRDLATDMLEESVTQKIGGNKTGAAQGLRDLSGIRQYLSGSGILPLFDSPFVIVFLGVVFLMHWVLGLVALSGALILFAAAYANEQSTRKLVTDGNGMAMRALNEADTAARNADVINALGMLPNLQRRWQSASDEFLDLQSRASLRGNYISSFARAMRMGVQVCLLGTGAVLVTVSELTAGGMIAASIIAGRALAPVEQSISGWRALLTAQAAWLRVNERMARLAANPRNDMTLPTPSGRLTVDEASYVPAPGARPILRDVSFGLELGTALGIVGPSSAGKTTLARLLVGSLQATSGTVRLDDADIAKWRADDRGPHIGYLPQDVELFNGTVKENIARMGYATDDEVIEAAKMAGVHESILHLPDGYDTVIGDGGLALSGGGRQRIALARALFGNPRFVVLDEPNANLDSEGEQALVSALARLKVNGTTVVLISHRPKIMNRMDKMLVMIDGRVAMFGDRDDVNQRLQQPITVEGEGPGRPHRRVTARPPKAETRDVSEVDAPVDSVDNVERDAAAESFAPPKNGNVRPDIIDHEPDAPSSPRNGKKSSPGPQGKGRAAPKPRARPSNKRRGDSPARKSVPPQSRARAATHLEASDADPDAPAIN